MKARQATKNRKRQEAISVGGEYLKRIRAATEVFREVGRALGVIAERMREDFRKLAKEHPELFT